MNGSYQDFGYFDEQRGCFVLTAEPPRKWWNLHCTAIHNDGIEMYSEVAHINDGPTWVRDKDGVTTLLVGYDQKYHYIRDEDSGVVFCPAGAPAPHPVRDREVRFFRHKTEMSCTAEGVSVLQRVFVPRELPVECTSISITNPGDGSRRFSVFSYAMFQLTGCDAEGRGVWKENFAEVHPRIRGVFCTNRSTSVPNHRFKAFLVTLSDGFLNANGYRDHFTRAEYSVGTPRILWGWNCDGQPGYGPDCAGIVQVSVEVPAGETRRVDFLLGQAASVDEVASVIAPITPQTLDQWCEQARLVEDARADAYRIQIGHPLAEGIFNIFLKKQHYTYLINKSGFRDNLQVDAALAMSDYPAAEANFLRALASQYESGSVPHGFRPLNRQQYSDKPAWILFALPELLKESGDFSLLEREVPFFQSSARASVWEHALRAMRFLASDTGAHGLCDQHHADWNDGLEATAEAGDRESVMVSMQFCAGLREIAEIARRIGDSSVEAEAAQLYQEFKHRINSVAWDGEWYVRTLCGDGYRIGSKDCEFGQIYLNTQSWAVISGVADDARARAIMAKVDEILETDIGYRICFPPYARYDARVGRMSNSMPGANENGGCYNHAAGFKGVADCLLGRAEQAWRTFTKVTPDSPENPIARSGAEPFSYVNSYSSVPHVYGKSGYAWRTGTSGWMALLLIEYIIGARRGYDRLEIKPCLPAALPEVRLQRRFRGQLHDIHIRQTSPNSAPEITVNGQSWA